MPTRQEVYEAIDSERAYQQHRWGVEHDKQHTSPCPWLVYIKTYVDEAFALATFNEPEVNDTLRKIAGLSVAAMEQLGAPKREGF